MSAKTLSVPRLLLSYLLIPLIPPVLLLLDMRRGSAMAFGDALGIVFIYAPFGLAAMIMLGMPLLLGCLRLGWTGFVPFMAGGGLCAAFTSYLVLRGKHSSGLVVFFAIGGLVSGLCFRAILFGFRPQPSVAGTRRGSRAMQIVIAAIGTIAAAAFVFGLYSISDDHRTVTERMGWQCTGITDTKDPKFKHIESVKLWFSKNPHYEEHASGPSLCADLKAAGQDYVAVTFDVWGNRVVGLHGYNGVAMSAGAKPLITYGFDSGGFHDDTVHYGNYDSRQHPEVSRFPLEVFR